MFFFFLEPVLIYNWLLILAAVIPAIFLMIKVYQSDRLEPESPYLLRKMVTGGIWSAVVAGILEGQISFCQINFSPVLPDRMASPGKRRS